MKYNILPKAIEEREVMLVYIFGPNSYNEVSKDAYFDLAQGLIAHLRMIPPPTWDLEIYYDRAYGYGYEWDQGKSIPVTF